MVVYTGTIGKVNGLEYLVRLAAIVNGIAPEIRFSGCPDGRERNVVQSAAQQLGIFERNFFMLGQVPKHEIPAILSAANVATSLTIPSPELTGDSANKVFDAARPPDAPSRSNHGGWLADLIRQRGFGLVLDPCDMQAAGKALVELLADRRRLASTGEAARRTGRELFDRDQLAFQLEGILLRAAGQSPSIRESICLAGQP